MPPLTTSPNCWRWPGGSVRNKGVSNPVFGNAAVRPPQRPLYGCLTTKLLALVLLSVTGLAFAAGESGGGFLTVNSSPTGGGGHSYSIPVQTLLFFTVLSFLPAVMLMMTAFTRIIIVMSLLRQALGTQSTPPNQVLIGLSLFLTLFVMQPAIDKIYSDAYLPYSQQKISIDEALARGQQPLKAFMLKQTREPDLMLFSKLGRYDGAVTLEA
ncbi:MAG: hypothetical protein JNM52_07565, partial [Betaproteobacteria bacterium]|nr:hypothetical protein [Betaproteobacteria bacterium]